MAAVHWFGQWGLALFAGIWLLRGLVLLAGGIRHRDVVSRRRGWLHLGLGAGWLPLVLVARDFITADPLWENLLVWPALAVGFGCFLLLERDDRRQRRVAADREVRSR